MTRNRLNLLALLTAVICITGACAPSLRELAVRVPYTDGGYTPPEGDEMAPALHELRGRLEAWGVEIDFEDGQSRVGGANLVEQAIVLKAGMSPNAEFEVLAHEAGHLFQPRTVELRSHGEAFAEAVAVGVVEYYGRPYKASSARYLALYKLGLSVIDDLQIDIDFAVKALTGQVEFEGFWR